MANKITEKIIIGSLMNNPLLLAESDKYFLTTDDFDALIHQYLFYAIYQVAAQGSTKIAVQDIDLFLNDSMGKGALFRENNGIELLHDAIELANQESFPVYYNILKKENLLRDLSHLGFDTSKFYEKNPLTDEKIKVNDNYLELSNADIIEEIKRDIFELEGSYIQGSATEEQDAFQGLEELLSDLEENPDIGMPLAGDIFNAVCGGARLGALYVRSAPSGLGKALPNSTKIPTPLGWREVGEVRAGDYLFDALGKPTKVTGVFPQGKKEVWEVHFKDGRKAKSSPDHLWSYNTCGQKQKSKDERKFFTKTLKDIAAEGLRSGLGYRVLVPQHHAVEYGEKKLPIPPYVLGLAIGDGSFRQHDSNKSFQFSSETDELPRVIADTMGYTLKRGSEHNYAWYFGSQKQSGGRKKNIWVEDFLRELPELINTTSANKYVPEMYLYSSAEQRLDLLNGLLDSDGTVDKKGRVEFFTNSSKLRDNVIELASSLGYFVTVYEANHRKNVNYIINITGAPELKNKLFKLTRKRKLMEDWYNNGKRKERNAHNPIVDIINLGYEEDMTCFMVDNEEHLFLTEDFIVTHNTRLAMGDACQLAFPIRYNAKTLRWEQTGFNEKVLVVITEQVFREVQLMMLAYLTDMNERKIKRKHLRSSLEDKVLLQAVQVVEHFKDNIRFVQMPSPTLEGVKSTLRREVLLHNIQYVFYDYIFISPSIIREFQGVNLRNDEVLLMLATALKEIAVELNIFIMTSTQVNHNIENNKEIRNESSIAGSKAIINKADFGCMMARPTQEELKTLENLIVETGIEEPNTVTDVYKNRGDQWTQLRIWSTLDLGTMKRIDHFVTNSRLVALDDFSIDNYHFPVDYSVVGDLLEKLNRKE